MSDPYICLQAEEMTDLDEVVEVSWIEDPML
jgi:hypothetical protein